MSLLSLQFRLTNGTTITGSFKASDPLSTAQGYVSANRTDGSTPCALMTSFPRKTFTAADMNTTMKDAGLVPSAVLILTKLWDVHANRTVSRNSFDFMTSFPGTTLHESGLLTIRKYQQTQSILLALEIKSIHSETCLFLKKAKYLKFNWRDTEGFYFVITLRLELLEWVEVSFPFLRSQGILIFSWTLRPWEPGYPFLLW
jgi:hypothetical protein